MGTRGRKRIEITSVQLQDAIRELERAQPDGKFPNRSALWAALEATEWAKSRTPRPLTAQVAMVLAKHSDLTIQTPVGMRGRQKGCGPVSVGPRKRKGVNSDILSALKSGMPEKYHPIADKAAKGSLKAVIKLKCLDCCNWQQREVALCTVTACPNWGYRPYKDKLSLSAEGRKKISLGLLEDDNEPETNGT